MNALVIFSSPQYMGVLSLIKKVLSPSHLNKYIYNGFARDMKREFSFFMSYLSFAIHASVPLAETRTSSYKNQQNMSCQEDEIILQLQ